MSTSTEVTCVGEARLRWFGNVQRRDNYNGRTLRLELRGSRRWRGRPKRRFMAVVKEDMKLTGVRLEDAEDRSKWRQMIHCGVP